VDSTDGAKPERTENATFGAGCFWQPEAELKQLPGVLDTQVGYEGGHVDNPTYEQVCSGTTGHAEVTQVEFDPEQVSYEDLLDRFWEMHDPTQVNRQGPDVGDQYRTVIFFHSPEQEAAARAAVERVDSTLRWPKKVVTEIAPAAEFWPAEEYHQRYLEKMGRAACTAELATG